MSAVQRSGAGPSSGHPQCRVEAKACATFQQPPANDTFGVSATRIGGPPLTAPQRFLMPLLLMACMTVRAAPPHPGVPCESRGLAFDDKSVAWSHLPLSKLKRDTVYQVVQDGDRSAVLRATADASASLFVVPFKPALRTPMTLSWDWKTDALIADADNRDKNREDATLRILVDFDGDVTTLPDAERKRSVARRTWPAASSPTRC